MASISRRGGAAVAGLAITATTLVASLGAAPAARAATTVTPAFYSGATEADVVRLTLDLPAAIPNVPNPAALGLISASGSALHNTLGQLTNQAQSFAGLASGNLVQGPAAPLSALDKYVRTSGNGQQASNLQQIDPSSNPLGLGGTLGALQAASALALPASSSQGRLATLSIGALQSILPAAAVQAIRTAYSSVEPSAQSAVNQAVSQVDQVLKPIAAADPTGTAAGLEKAVNALPAQLDCANNADCLLNQILSSPLVSLDGLDAQQTIGTVRDGAQATAQAALLKANILSGLLTINGFTSTATAFADGVAGHATAKGNTILAQALVDHGLVGVDLGANGTILGVSVSGVSNQLAQQLNSALTQIVDTLNGVLGTLGVHVNTTQGTQTVRPDGTSASATGAVLDISVDQPQAAPGAAPLVDVRVGGTDSVINSRVAPPTGGVIRETVLPHTGANLPLTAGAGLALLGVAWLIRRRVLRAL